MSTFAFNEVDGAPAATLFSPWPVPPVVPDTAAPVVSGPSPAAGEIAPDDSIALTVSDVVALFSTLVWVEYVDGVVEVVYNSLDTASPYASGYSGTAVPGAGSLALEFTRTGGYKKAFSLHVDIVDSVVNHGSYSYGYTLDPDPSDAPAIQEISSTTVAYNGSLIFDVTDTYGGPSIVDIDCIRTSGAREGVRRGTANASGQVSPYVVVKANITDGYRYTISKTGGFIDDGVGFTFSFVVTDSHGNSITAASSTYVVSPAIPVVGDQVPVLAWITAPGSVLQSTDPVSFSIADNSLAVVVLSVQFPASGAEEVVYRDGAFASQYAASTATPVTALGVTTTTYVIRRANGWPKTFRFRVNGADIVGHVI